MVPTSHRRSVSLSHRVGLIVTPYRRLRLDVHSASNLFGMRAQNQADRQSATTSPAPVAGHPPADADWAAPTAAAAVKASVDLPGSKSITNRALVLAGLADTPTTIVRPLQARDTELMAGAIVALGATVDAATDGAAGSAAEGTQSWVVQPGRAAGTVRVEVGNAGTVLRFVPPMAALAAGDVEFTGDPRASARPVGQLLDGLRQAGVQISDSGRGSVPFTVHGSGGARGGAVTLDASSSSQLVSGLLLSAPRYEQGIEVAHRGERIPTAPHIAMTVAMLRAAGADVETRTSGRGSRPVPDFWRVRPGRLTPGTIAVEPDLSNAAPFLAAAVVTGGCVTIPGWPADSLQASGQILDVLEQMGAVCHRTATGLQIEGTGRIRGISADLRDINEVAPVLTALAALADSPSELTGIGHMRFHESDRLAVLATEIGALGGDVTELPDGLVVRPRPLRAGTEPFDSHDDHRMVMAAAVLGLAVPGLRVRNAATVGKTFPAFLSLWSQLAGQAP
jgi:3-phosphoshikimate 1-carboxyvinyltransferase